MIEKTINEIPISLVMITAEWNGLKIIKNPAIVTSTAVTAESHHPGIKSLIETDLKISPIPLTTRNSPIKN